MIVIEIIRVWLSHFLGGGDLWKVIRFANEDRIVDEFKKKIGSFVKNENELKT